MKKVKKIMLRFVFVQIIVGLLFFLPASSFAEVEDSAPNSTSTTTNSTSSIVAGSTSTGSSNCVSTAVGSPNGQPQLPPGCQTQTTSASSCNSSIIPQNISYADGNYNLSVTVWGCGKAAPLVVFVPGQSRNAADYARYEKAIADQGFIVAGINFNGLNSNNHPQTLNSELADTKSLIQKVISDPTLKKSISNPNSIGLIGHSDGGIVVSMEGYSGGNLSNVKAIVALDGGAGVSKAGPPLFIGYGAKDFNGTAGATNTYNTMAQSNYANPVYLAIFKNADHFCYVSEKSVPGYGITCETGGYQPATQALDALTGAFLHQQLGGCSDSLSNLSTQYKSVLDAFNQHGNAPSNTPCSTYTLTSFVTGTGVNYPPNIQCRADGYCQMPNSTDGSYQFLAPACPTHHWGSKLLIGVLYTVAENWHKQYPNGHLTIWDMNAAGHLSHMWGRAADIDATTNGSDHVANSTAGNFNRPATMELGEMFLNTNQILNIWDSRVGEPSEFYDYIKNHTIKLYGTIGDPSNVPGMHFNHFHVDVNLHPLLPVYTPALVPGCY